MDGTFYAKMITFLFFSLGDSPLSYFWILCWRLSKSLLLLREYLKKYYKIKVPENDDVNL